MGTHAKVRKSATKTWLMPAVSTAVAVAAPGAIGESVAAPFASSAVSNVSNLTIAPQASTPEFAALKAHFAKRKAVRLSVGSKGSNVKWVQYKLNVRKTGNFGPLTRAAVKRFQRAKGLEAVGVVGPKTWAKLHAIGKGKTWKPGTTAKSRVSRASRSSRSSMSSSKVNRVLAAGLALKGMKYEYGGESVNPRNSRGGGMDCSWFVNIVFDKVGVNLPRSSRQIYAYLRARGKTISKSQARPGDLFFVRDSGGIFHVGIVGRNGTWVEARNSRYDVGVFKPWARSHETVLYARAL